MLSFWKRKFELWRYKRKVIGHLAILFKGFPAEEYSNPEALRDLPRLIPMLHEEMPADPAVGAVFAAAVFIGGEIDQMNATEREETLAALQGRDLNNFTSAGIVQMIEVAASLASDTHVRMLRYQILGKLSGMDQAAIRKWRPDSAGNPHETSSLAA